MVNDLFVKSLHEQKRREKKVLKGKKEVQRRFTTWRSYDKRRIGMNIRHLIRHRRVPMVPGSYKRRAMSSLTIPSSPVPPQTTTNKFEILMNQIKEDPSIVRESLSKLRAIYGEKEFSEKVTDHVQDHLKSRPYDLSIFHCLMNSSLLSRSVNHQLFISFQKKDITDSQKYDNMIAFFKTLDKVIPPNDFQNKIKLGKKLEATILAITPRLHYKELFILLMNINCYIGSKSPLSKLAYELRYGTADEFYTFMNARLPSEKPKNDPDLLMQNNYTFPMFADVLRVYTRLRNSLGFSKVISLMFQKIEEDKLTRVSKNLLLSRVYEHIMSHVLAKYSLKPSLMILQDMQNNGIPVSNRMLMILLNSFTMDSDLKNYAIFTNFLLELYSKHNQKLDSTTVQVIANQMLKIIQNSSFSHADLKIIVGYTLSFFNESAPLLQELGLLTLAYGTNIDMDSKLIKADISDELQILKYPPITSLEQVYKAVFRYMNFNKTMTLPILQDLYVNFRNTVITVQNLEKTNDKYKHHPFSFENMNEKILKLFMRQFLYRFSDFESAAEVLDDFSKNIHIKQLSNSLVYDMVINYYLRKGDILNAFTWFNKLTNAYDVRINLKPLVRLIVKSHEINSEISRSICISLIKGHLLPLIRANVYDQHLNPKLRTIISDLQLEHLFNMELPQEIFDTGLKPGRTVDYALDLEKEFNHTMIESFNVEAVHGSDVAIDETPFDVSEDDTEDIFEISDMQTAIDETPFEVNEEDDEEIFEISDMETANDDVEIFSNIEIVPELVYDEKLDSIIHPQRQVTKKDKPIDTDDAIKEISSLSHPSYRQMMKKDDSMTRKRKQFLQMLADATNDDLIVLLLNFLKKYDKHIIFYKNNINYKNFHVTRNPQELTKKTRR